MKYTVKTLKKIQDGKKKANELLQKINRASLDLDIAINNSKKK